MPTLPTTFYCRRRPQCARGLAWRPACEGPRVHAMQEALRNSTAVGEAPGLSSQLADIALPVQFMQQAVPHIQWHRSSSKGGTS